MYRKTKIFAVFLTLGLLICSQEKVYAATQDHVHTYTFYDRRLVYEKTERNCVYDAGCEITTRGYECVNICSAVGCDAKQYYSQTTTSHSVHH